MDNEPLPGTDTNADNGPLAALLARLGAGDTTALAELAALCDRTLLRAVRLRMDPRVRSKLDAEEVLQNAYLTITQRAATYDPHGPMPPFVWVRFLTLQELQRMHRHYLGTAKRNACLEVSLHHGGLPQTSSACLADMLLGRARPRPGCKPLTSPSEAAVRAETRLRVQAALNQMNAIDREVLTMRHFEGMGNQEVALTLGLTPKAANHRYARAKERLGQILRENGL